MRTQHIVFRNMVAQAGRLGAQGFAQLLVGILIARWLGFAALGIYAFVYAVVAGAAIFSDAGVTIFLSAEVAREREHVNLYVSNLLLPTTLLGMLLSGVVFVLLRLFVTKGQLGLAGSLCATAVIAAGMASVLRGAVYAFERLDLEFYSIVIQEGLFTVAVAGMLIFHAGLSAVFVAFLITRWIGAFSLLYFYHQHIAGLKWRIDWRAIFDILRRTLPYGIHAFSSVISLRADTAVVYILLGPVATGLYEAAANVSFRLAILLPRIFTTALLPSLSRQLSEPGAEVAGPKVLRKLFLGTAAVGLAVCGIFFAFAGPIFHLAYGRLADESNLVRLLAGAIAFHYVSALLGTWLTAKNLQKLRTRAVGITAAAAVVLSVALVSFRGIYGAGLAILISQFLMVALLYKDSARSLAAGSRAAEGLAKLPPGVSSLPEAGVGKRVGIVVREFGPPWNEGIRNLCCELAKFLHARNADVVVIAARVRGHNGIPWLPVAGVKGRDLFSFPLFAGWKARRLELDTLVLFSAHSVLVGLKAALLRWASGARVVVYIPGLSRILHPNVRGSLPANGCQYVVGSKFLQTYLPGAEIVPPWVGLERNTANSHSPPGDRRRILYLGAFEPGRGVLVLLRAHALLRRTRPGTRLYIGWNGFGREHTGTIRRFVRDLALQESITFLNVRERAEAYENADVVVIPHVVEHYMAFPIRIVEAAQAGKPMVVTTACDMHKLIDGCGLSAPAGDANALARAIQALLTDDELYARCQEGCRKFYERYHPEKSLGALYEILQAGG